MSKKLLRSRIEICVDDQVRKQFYAKVWQPFQSQASALAAHWIRDQIEDGARDQVWDQVRGQARNKIYVHILMLTRNLR